MTNIRQHGVNVRGGYVEMVGNKVRRRWVLLLHLKCLGINHHQVGFGRVLRRHSYTCGGGSGL